MLLLAFALGVQLTPDVAATSYKQPQLAISKNHVALTFGAASSIYFATSHDAANTFSQPKVVATVPKLMLGRHRGPRIALAGNTIVIAAISNGDLVSWRSGDKGQSWSKQVRVNDVPNSAREGLHALAAGSGGVLLATWLDLRTNSMILYGSISRDSGLTWEKNRLIYASPDGHICECCHPSALVSANGTLHVMWRNWLAGSRDMWTSSSSDEGKTWTARKLGEGTWPLEACPMDGGGLFIDASGNLSSVWRRNRVIFASRPGEPEKHLGFGKDPAVTAGYVAWTDGPAIKLLKPQATEPETLSEEGAFVSLAGAGPVFAAWEEKGTIRVRKIGD